jgi:hypothetical protein
MIPSARIGQKARRLISLAEQLAGKPGRVADCCYQLLGADGSVRGFFPGASCLNNDGSPLQLCLTSGHKGIALRAIGDPGAFYSSTEERYSSSIQTLLSVIESNDALELTPLAKETIALLIPQACEERNAYKQGFVWIAASPDQPGIAFYLEMAWLGLENAWRAVERWLAHVLPSPDAARRRVKTLSRHCVVASAGLEGSTVANTRAKIYFRLLKAIGLGALEVDMFSSKEMKDFLSIAMGSYEVDREGLVMSVGFSLLTGELADAKIDLCGHCLTHTPGEWSSVVRHITRRFSLAPLDTDPVLESGEYQVAFIGLGLTTDYQPRLNLYAKHNAPTGAPELDELRSALADAVGYLQSIQNQDGSWSDFHLPVGASDQWVTACAALALAQCGETSCSSDVAAAVKGATWLSENRTYKAGWGYNGATGPDSDSTAIAIALFDELGMSVPEQDRAFLRNHWRDGDGIATFDGPEAWGAGHWDVTPWGYHGMLPEDRELYRQRFLLALWNNRMGNGFWRAYWWRNPYYSTFVTLEVLERLGIPEPEAALDESAPSIHVDNPFDLGCYIGIESLRDPSDHRIGGHLRALLNWQEGDGRWPCAANLRVTDHQCYAPWDSPEGAYYEDRQSVLTTATIARILSRILAGKNHTLRRDIFAG